MLLKSQLSSPQTGAAEGAIETGVGVRAGSVWEHVRVMFVTLKHLIGKYYDMDR